MDRKSPSNTIFSRLNPEKIEYLSPVPVSPRMVTCDQKASLRPQGQISSSFVNYIIEIPNDSGIKRKLDDSSLNDCYGSKVKKPYIPVSPDLGCWMDYSSPLLRRENTQTSSVETEEIVNPRLDLDIVESGSSSCPKDEVEAEHSSKSEKIFLRLSPTFDHDVEDILCINPLKEAKKENKESTRAVLVEEEDKGYVSTSRHDQKEGHQTESSPEPLHHEQPPLHAQQVSFLKEDLNTSVALLKPANSSVRCLEGDEEEEGTWNIGPPLFESSLCQLTDAVEPKRLVSEIVKEPDYVCQTYSTCDSTLGTTYEDSLPIQVQVKSKVEIPSRPGISRPAQEQRAESVRSRSSNIWNNKIEWERQKRQYVASVTSHMNENQGFVTELENLMTHVSEQTGSNGAHWQHPSDLTCRNYQKRFGNETPSMTLGEWQANNLKTHKRFYKVPKIFERSPFP